MMNEFKAIQRIDIRQDNPVNFDVFIHLPKNDKYLLYKKRDAAFDQQELDKFKLLKIPNFYVRTEDYAKFVEYVSRTLIQIMDSPLGEDRTFLLRQSTKELLSNTFKVDDFRGTAELIENLNNIASKLIEYTLKSSTPSNQKLYAKMAVIAKNGTDFHKHPVNVSSFAILIAIGLGHTDEKILGDLTLASLLHDVGLSRLPPHLIDRRHTIDGLSEKDTQLLKKHPYYSLDIIRENKIKISQLVETIILQHHEHYDGRGYPRALKGYMLNELSQILNFADDLDERIAYSRPVQVSPLQLLKDILLHNQTQKTIQPALLKKIAELFEN